MSLKIQIKTIYLIRNELDKRGIEYSVKYGVRLITKKLIEN